MQGITRKRRLDEFAELLSGRIAEARDPEGSKAAFRKLAEMIPCVIWTADPDGSITWFNRYYYEFSGLDHRDYRTLLHPDDVEQHNARWRESCTLVRQHVSRSRIRAQNGDYHLMMTRANPVMDALGGVSYWIGSTIIVCPAAMLAAAQVA